ncbi:hypothetical protein [Amycolatopsis minnesotensis]|uniref:Uncharacterized protein n=1 Tax=Amycolatopsis minnesotensis TaxID=337894 RepID=A0ABN2SB91_9PSEU
MEIPDGWGARFARMFAVIEQWQARIEQEPLTPSAGSSLAADDTTFPSLPASSAAYNGLVAAIEHLDFFRAALTATRTLYPVAYYTVLRSALMGSAQAVWVLAPRQRSTRVENALRIAVDSYNQERKLINDITNLTAEQQVIADRNLATLSTRLSAAAAAADALGVNGATVANWTLNMTTVIKEAIALAFPENTADSGRVRESSGMLWRSQSGHAHGTPYSRLSLIRDGDLVRRPDGTAYARSTSPIEHIGLAAAAPTLLVSEAWRLYDLRCKA